MFRINAICRSMTRRIHQRIFFTLHYRTLLGGVVFIGTGLWRPAHAQLPRTFSHNRLLWTEASVEGKIKGKFFYDLDFQYRRQADADDTPGGDRWAIAKHPSEMVLRPFLSYKPSTHLTVSLSPIGWYGRWIISPTQPLSLTPELRTVPQISYASKLGRLRLEQRGRYEFRWSGERHPVTGGWDIDEGYNFTAEDHRQRLRYRLRANWPLLRDTPDRWVLRVEDEVFLNLGPNRPTGSPLDQNRAFAGMAYTLPGDITLEAGYLHQVLLRLTPALPLDVRLNQVLFVSVQANDLNRFFSRR